MFDTNGDGTGETNAVGEYQDAEPGEGETEFFVTMPEGEAMIIGSGRFYIEDAGAFDSGKYGNSLVLVNGIKLHLQDADGNIVLDFFQDGGVIMTNAQLAAIGQLPVYLDFGQGNNSLVVSWTAESFATHLLLTHENKLVVTLNDDFSDLVQHRFIVYGHNPFIDYKGEVIK